MKLKQLLISFRLTVKVKSVDFCRKSILTRADSMKINILRNNQRLLGKRRIFIYFTWSVPSFFRILVAQVNNLENVTFLTRKICEKNYITLRRQWDLEV